MSKKILIIGNSAKESALAKYFINNGEKVYVIPGNSAISEFAECVDIRANDITALLEFALENAIDIVIPSDVNFFTDYSTDIFSKNNINIFAPTVQIFEMLNDKLWAKKILYKLKIPTPRFGIFEKSNVANDYIKNLDMPVVIKTNASPSATIVTSSNSARLIIESVLAEKQKKVMIEDYVWGSAFAFYVVTDGYKALPLGSSTIYKHSLEGNGGQLTCGMGAYSPAPKLSYKNEKFLMDKVIYPTLKYLEENYTPYCGILGINGILTEDEKIFILGYSSFMQDCDCPAILETLDENLYELFYSCIVGSFSDEINEIKYNNKQAISVSLLSKNKKQEFNPILGIDDLDEVVKTDFCYNVQKNKYLEYNAQTGINIILTTSAQTLNKAKEVLRENINCINFDGMNYRKDILS